MTDYPRLTEMGVLHYQQITRFTVNSLDHTDYLRIFYKRPGGSLLPTSRSYEFPRVQVGGESGSGSDSSAVVMQSNPAFKEAVGELESIMSARESKEGLAEAMRNEVRQLEEDIAMHVECLESLIEKMRSI